MAARVAPLTRYRQLPQIVDIYWRLGDPEISGPKIANIDTARLVRHGHPGQPAAFRIERRLHHPKLIARRRDDPGLTVDMMCSHRRPGHRVDTRPLHIRVEAPLGPSPAVGRDEAVEEFEPHRLGLGGRPVG